MLTNDIVSFKQLGPDIFLISPQKTCCGSHWKCLSKELPMSTHNMFSWRNKKQRILYEWSFNIKFMKRVWVISGYFASLGKQNSEITLPVS